jgi:hypothetical protein
MLLRTVIERVTCQSDKRGPKEWARAVKRWLALALWPPNRNQVGTRHAQPFRSLGASAIAALRSQIDTNCGGWLSRQAGRCIVLPTKGIEKRHLASHLLQVATLVVTCRSVRRKWGQNCFSSREQL